MESAMDVLGDLFNSEDPQTSSTAVNNSSPTNEMYNAAIKKSYKKNLDMLKKKVIFTDNLISSYTDIKLENENFRQQITTLEQRCKDKENENKIIQSQLKSILSTHDHGKEEMQAKQIAELESTIETLNDRLKSMDMTCQMYEDKIHEMKVGETTKDLEKEKFETERSQYEKEIKTLKKTNKSLEREILSLKRKNEVVHEKLRRRRSSKGSQPTDSDFNMSMQSADAITEADVTTDANQSGFKSPTSERRKRLHKKHRKSEVTDPSDEEFVDPVQSIKKSPKESGNQAHGKSVKEVDRSPKPVVESSFDRRLSSDRPGLERKQQISEMSTGHNGIEESILGEQKAQADDRDSQVGKDEQTSSEQSERPVKASPPKPVVTNQMKSNIRLMRAKRAFRTFQRRPSSDQMAEMKLIVDRLKESDSSAAEQIQTFCEKYTLTGHESLVARRLLKLFQEKLSSVAKEKLNAITNAGKDAISSTETESESNAPKRQSAMPTATTKPSPPETKKIPENVSKITESRLGVEQMDAANTSISDIQISTVVGNYVSTPYSVRKKSFTSQGDTVALTTTTASLPISNVPIETPKSPRHQSESHDMKTLLETPKSPPIHDILGPQPDTIAHGVFSPGDSDFHGFSPSTPPTGELESHEATAGCRDPTDSSLTSSLTPPSSGKEKPNRTGDSAQGDFSFSSLFTQRDAFKEKITPDADVSFTNLFTPRISTENRETISETSPDSSLSSPSTPSSTGKFIAKRTVARNLESPYDKLGSNAGNLTQSPIEDLVSPIVERARSLTPPSSEDEMGRIGADPELLSVDVEKLNKKRDKNAATGLFSTDASLSSQKTEKSVVSTDRDLPGFQKSNDKSDQSVEVFDLEKFTKKRDKNVAKGLFSTDVSLNSQKTEKSAISTDMDLPGLRKSTNTADQSTDVIDLKKFTKKRDKKATKGLFSTDVSLSSQKTEKSSISTDMDLPDAQKSPNKPDQFTNFAGDLELPTPDLPNHDDPMPSESTGTMMDSIPRMLSMFSSDEDGEGCSFQHPMSPLVSSPHPLTRKRMRTRSMSNSVSGAESNCATPKKRKSQGEASPQKISNPPTEVASPKEVKPHVTISAQSPCEPPANAPDVNSPAKVRTTSTCNNESETPAKRKSKAGKKEAKASRKRKRKRDSAKSPAPKKAKADKEDSHFAVIKSEQFSDNNAPTAVDKEPTEKAPPTMEKKSKKPKTIVAEKVAQAKPKPNHPPLTKMSSMPFVVGSDSPCSLGSKPTDFSFLHESIASPASEDQASDNEPDPHQVFSSPSPPDLLEEMLNDLIDLTPAPLSPLNRHTPTPIVEKRFGNPVDQTDEDVIIISSDDDSEGRASISPSADLCTAFSFNKTRIKSEPLEIITKKESPTLAEADTTSKLSPPPQPSTPHHKMPSTLRDTPRRFSCEAPVRAVNVPLVKPVVKLAKSLDPSLLSSAPNAPRNKDQEDVAKIGTTSEKDPQGTQALSHVVNGPFREVPRNKSSDSILTNPAAKDGFEAIPPPTTPVSNDSEEVSESNPVVSKNPKATPLQLLQSKSRFVFKHVKVESPKAKPKPKEQPDPASSLPLQKQKKAAPKWRQANANNPGIADVSVEDELLRLRSGPAKLVRPNYARIWAQTNVACYKDAFKLSAEPELLAVFESIQNYAMKNDDGRFPEVSEKTVLTWMATYVKGTRSNEFAAILAEHLEQRSTGVNSDPDLAAILHKSVYFFVRLLCLVDEARSSNGIPGFLKRSVLPVILKVMCRFCLEFPTNPALGQYGVAFEAFSPVMHKRQLQSYESLALSLVFACLCRYTGSASDLLAFCQHALIAKNNDSLLCCMRMFCCWPSALNQWHPLTGKMFLFGLKNLPREFGNPVLKRERPNIYQLLATDESSRDLVREHTTSVKLRTEEAFVDALLQTCVWRMKSARLAPRRSGSGTAELSMERQDDVLNCLKMFCVRDPIKVISARLIDKYLWPLLNSWSRHLVLKKDDESKEVSDACMIAVLKCLTVVLLAKVTKQRLWHPSHNTHAEARSYFETICALLANFTHNFQNAPTIVQCATAATVINLCFCRPSLAHGALHNWLAATGSADPGPHPLTPQIEAFHNGPDMKKTVEWLEVRKEQRTAEGGKSLIKLIWG